MLKCTNVMCPAYSGFEKWLRHATHTSIKIKNFLATSFVHWVCWLMVLGAFLFFSLQSEPLNPICLSSSGSFKQKLFKTTLKKNESVVHLRCPTCFRYTAEWFSYTYIYACVLNRFSCVRLFATLWTVARQAPLSMEFFRQEYWSGFPCPPPGESSQPRDPTHASYISCIGRWVLYH